MNISTAERFARKLSIDTHGCHLWTGGTDPTGYGRFYLDGRMAYAHRVAVELHQGPIPAGMVVDHLCRVRNCVNPEHLEVVTQRENLLRGDTLTAAHVEGRDCGHAECVSCGRRAAS